jgi:hypothetical protein
MLTSVPHDLEAGRHCPEDLAALKASPAAHEASLTGQHLARHVAGGAG